MSTIDPDLGNRLVAKAVAFRDLRRRLVLRVKGAERVTGAPSAHPGDRVNEGWHSDPTADSAVANLEAIEDAVRQLRECDETGQLIENVFKRELIRFAEREEVPPASEAGDCAHHWERLQQLMPRDGKSRLCSFCRHWKQKRKALPCDRVLEAKTLYPERRLNEDLIWELENTEIPVESVMGRELLSPEESRARVGQRDPAAAWFHPPARSRDVPWGTGEPDGTASDWTKDPQ
jgi:hypothetical protein